MNKKNILIIGNYPPPYGGVPHHIERLTEYLAERGWSCHVLSGGTSGYEKIGSVHVYKPTYARKLLGYLRQLFDRTFKLWLESGSLDRESPKFWARYSMYADIGGRIIKKHDIRLIASYNLYTYSPIGAWLSDKYKLPHIINIFGEIYKYESMLQNRMFFHRVAKSASQMLSCSTHCGNSVAKLGVDASVDTVTYGVNLAHFKPGNDPVVLRKSFGLHGLKVVLFVGRLSQEMGLDSFISAATKVSKQLTDVCFLMVGQAGDMMQEAKQICETSAGRFVMISNSPYDELPDFYRLADLVVVPTRGDRTCSSLAAMEAMATRKPVIGFAIGGIPEIIETEKTGLLVEPENVQALADSIFRLLTDSDLSKNIASAAYAASQERFDENMVNVNMERYFLKALG